MGTEFKFEELSLANACNGRVEEKFKTVERARAALDRAMEGE